MSASPVSVLTASFGDGHNSAARAVADALAIRRIPAEGPFDLLGQLFPSTMSACSAAYRRIITRWPRAWGALYALADRVSLGGEGFDLMAPLTRGLATYLRERRPGALVSTYPVYGQLVERLFGTGELPFSLLTVVTDARSINRAWLNRARGHFAVIDRPSATWFTDRGIDASRVHVTGFPVDPRFAAAAAGSQRESALPRPLSVLYVASTRRRHVRACLREIESACAGTETRLTVVLGRHADRLGETVRQAAPAGTEIIDWTDRMPELLGRHHLVIGKAGGASVQEALAAACPMLVNYVVPGQEEGNAELLTATGAGAVAETPAALSAALRQLCSDSGRGWLAMRRAAKRHARPLAAFEIADLLASMAGGDIR